MPQGHKTTVVDNKRKMGCQVGGSGAGGVIAVAVAKSTVGKRTTRPTEAKPARSCGFNYILG